VPESIVTEGSAETAAETAAEKANNTVDMGNIIVDTIYGWKVEEIVGWILEEAHAAIIAPRIRQHYIETPRTVYYYYYYF
jgi:hypothetical protein